MNRIYKYELKITDVQEVLLPINSKILSIKEQNGLIQLWAFINPSETNFEKNRIYIFGTGNPIPENYEDLIYIDTVIQEQFVWHVFKEEEK